MLDVLWARWKQGHRTMRYPAGPPPELPARFAGRPVIDVGKCAAGCRRCRDVCPVEAISSRPAPCGAGVSPAQGVSANWSPLPKGEGTAAPQLDIGRCLFCRECETACGTGAITFTRDHCLAASKRDDLVVRDAKSHSEVALDAAARRLFGRSFKLRQLSAGGCGACEADTNVLGTAAWDLGRFGIQFVASPRHADGLLITGPVTANMRLALEKTYQAVPAPKLVLAVGACAIAGGPYAGHPEVHDGAASVVPVDLFIPGCPPHPLTILEGLLSLVRGRESLHGA